MSGQTIYDLGTGQVLYWGKGAQPCDPASQGAYPGIWDNHRFVNGEPVELVPVAPLNPVEEWRKWVEVEMVTFLIAAAKQLLFTEVEVRTWLKRDALPAQVVTWVNSLPAAVRLETEIDLLGRAKIGRLHPLILKIAEVKGYTEAQLDAFFGGPPA